MLERGLVTTNWKLVQSLAGNDASDSSNALRSCKIKAGLPPSNSRIRPFVSRGIVCIVIIAGPVPQTAYSDPAASLRSLTKPAVTILRPAASSVEFQVQDVAGPAGVPLPLPIEVSESEEDKGGRLFIFTGIPKGVKLIPGGNLGLFWAVNSNAFDKLKLFAPEGFRGSFQIEVTQTDTSPEDARRKTSFLVTITPPDSRSKTKNLNAVVSRDRIRKSSRSRQTLQPDSTSLKDKKLMERALSFFRKGDISAARSIYQYLAARGDADAAIAMGRTYDPLVLNQLYIKGMTPDPVQAQNWYLKAEKLGSFEARRLLNALAQR